MPPTACQVLQSVATQLPHLGPKEAVGVEQLSALLRERGALPEVLSLALEALAVAVLGNPEAPPYAGLASWLHGASRRQLSEALTHAALGAALTQVAGALARWPLDAGSPGEAELDALLFAQGVRGALRDAALSRLRAEVVGEATAAHGALTPWLRQAGPDELRSVLARAARRRP